MNSGRIIESCLFYFPHNMYLKKLPPNVRINWITETIVQRTIEKVNGEEEQDQNDESGLYSSSSLISQYFFFLTVPVALHFSLLKDNESIILKKNSKVHFTKQDLSAVTLSLCPYNMDQYTSQQNDHKRNIV